MRESTIGELVKQLREEKGLSQKNLCVELETIQGLESGTTKPTVGTLYRIAKRLGNLEKLLIVAGYIEKNPQTVGKIILRYRLLNEITQKKFSQKIGISNNVLSKIEKDKKTPSLYVLKAITKAYPAISLLELMNIAGYISDEEYVKKLAVGKLVKQLREEKGLNQKNLAVLANIGVETISKIEIGISDPSLDIWHKIAGVLGNLEKLLATAGYISENPQTMGEIIRYHRAMQNLSVEKFSTMCGVNVKTLHNIESGKRKSRIRTIKVIVEKLPITLEELLVKTGYIPENPQTIGDFISRHRLLNGLSPAMVSSYGCLSRRRIKKIESGKCIPDEVALKVFANAFSTVSYAELLEAEKNVL